MLHLPDFLDRDKVHGTKLSHLPGQEQEPVLFFLAVRPAGASPTGRHRTVKAHAL
jgi:hypothetical protein